MIFYCQKAWVNKSTFQSQPIIKHLHSRDVLNSSSLEDLNIKLCATTIGFHDQNRGNILRGIADCASKFTNTFKSINLCF
jgi:hypothetical protein